MANEQRMRPRKRKKVCAFCVDKVTSIDYKDTAKLRRYLSERGGVLRRPDRQLLTDCDFQSSRKQRFRELFKVSMSIVGAEKNNHVALCRGVKAPARFL